MIGEDEWRCDICGKKYNRQRFLYRAMHDGKIYCQNCQMIWEKKQKQMIFAYMNEYEERKWQRIVAFETARIQNGEYQPEKGGKPAVVAAGLLTLDHINKSHRNDILWAEVYGNHKKCHKTEYSGSEFSGYHDEDNDYYRTSEVQTLPFLKTDNWFESEEWLQKTAVPHSANSSLDLDSIYYEGYGKATTTRWKTRWYQTDTFDGSLIIWLRRCTEGWRLLRISLDGLVIPFDFNFREDSIPMLYNQYAGKCNVFQDFQLTNEECAYIADGLLHIKHDTFQEAYKPRGNSINFILRSEHRVTKESIIPQSLLGELLRIRCLDEEDYWERRVNPDI